jgi:spore coat protein A, manganese oxidase
MKLKLKLSVVFAFALAGCGNKMSMQDAGVGDMAVPASGDMSGGDMTSTLAPGDMATGPDLDNHQPLSIPQAAVPLTVDGGVDYYEIHAQAAQQQVLPGAKTTIWGFNGTWPGPTIHATMGRTVAVKMFNDLPTANDSLTVHNHGHNVIAPYDGHPSQYQITQGSSYVYRYPNLQQGGTGPNYGGAGTYFYHDHEMGQTGLHFWMGLAGFYIIHPAPGSTEAGLGLPSGAFDVPLMVQDRSFSATNALVYTANTTPGTTGNLLLVNGTPHPFMQVARRKYRFRILNASNSRRLDVGLSKGSMSMIATDGGLMPAPLSTARIPLAPAERADIVVDFSQYKIGDVVSLVNDDTSASSLPEVLQFRVTSNATDTSMLPAALNPNPVTISDTDTRERTLVFAQTGGMWTINGQTFSSTPAFTETHINDVETWSLENTDPMIPHPFHQHLVQFQILDICPGATTAGCSTGPAPTQQGWKDTVLVPANSTVRIKMKFYYSGTGVAGVDPFPTTSMSSPNNYVFHCHNLEHEDNFMMLQQTVSP